mmetsp:Transcript_10273/g.35977  ORF Transcript_10273/g.35977 Transcript_10273/m.35977 type:complete len:1199 (+) Transcript_10273:66-3662(+)
MFCPSGHLIDAFGKKLRIFSSYSCDRCHKKVGDNGGLYHKCSNRCEFRVCEQCYRKAESAHYVFEPCTESFPNGLGPFSVHRTCMDAGDLKPFEVARRAWGHPHVGGAWALSSNFFAKSNAMRQVWGALDRNGLAAACQPGVFETGRPGSAACLVVQLSPATPVNLPESARRGLHLPEGPGFFVAWMYPLVLEWQPLIGDIDSSSLDSPEWSLLTVGGFVYMKSVAAGSTNRIDWLCANSIAYSPRGAMHFSAPQEWKAEWTQQLRRAGRFHKVTAQKWASAGAQFMSWVCPQEPIVTPRGLHGGFVFLFHGLEEPDTAGKDVFFEVVSVVETMRSSGGVEHTVSKVMPPKLMFSAFAFSLAGDPNLSSPVHRQRTRGRFLKAAAEGRWFLVGHLIGEWPYLATEADDNNRTALHQCAALHIAGSQANALLVALYQGGASIEAKDAEGRTPYDLGDQAFKALVCQIWGLIPDLFADPEVWFDFWDKSSNGILEPDELIPALAAAYNAGDLARQWIETYVHTHYRELVHGAALTKATMLGDNGLLHLLQSSEELIALRAREDAGSSQMPAIFRTEGRKLATAFDKAALEAFTVRVDDLAQRHGWRPGRPAPNSARALEVRAPFAGGSSDPIARLAVAKEMLAWTFTKTTALAGRDWLAGFKVAFKGGDDVGIDEGGLTKAWAQEIAFALWADDSFFETKSTGSFFKTDDSDDLMLHCFHIRAESLYRWTGRFLAYCVYHGCVLDCPLCPWVFRWLVRVTEEKSRAPPELRALAGDWQLPSGEVMTISGSSLFIRPEEDARPLEVPLSAREGRIWAQLKGNLVSAVLQGASLLWTNREVWTRCAESGHAPVGMPSWPDTPEGNDQLLEDLATMDAAFANSLWRVHHEMPASDLQWLTFSYAGIELEAGGDDIEVDEANKGRYVRLCCQAALLQQAQRGMQAFAEGFFEVLPQEITVGCPADTFQWLLVGDDEISVEQLDALEALVIPQGLVPKHLSDNAAVVECARWVFRTARAGSGKFRSRLFEFWTGSSRLPQGGVASIAPRPRLQVMVQAARPPSAPTWEIHLQDGWYNYDSSTAADMTRAMDAGQASVEFKVRENRYVVDFTTMVQVNLRTGARREVRRTDAPEEEVADAGGGGGSPLSPACIAGVRRIETWPAPRLPEGHTCGNELWVPLCDSEEQLSRSLTLSVMNFEAGFALA